MVSLQALKTMFFWQALLSRQQCKAYASKTKLGPPTFQELAFFLSIQEALSQTSILVYHNPKKILWIDLNASKEFGLEAMVFHTTFNKIIPKRHWPFINTVQQILFFYRLLALTKKNYWPTDLNIVGFM